MRPQMENIQKSGWRSITGKIKKRSWIVLSLVLTVILLFTLSAQAMTSTNYKLDWYVPLSGGGGHASSASYAIDYTVGQTASGNASSTSYSTGLGFWAAVWQRWIYLPLIFR